MFESFLAPVIIDLSSFTMTLPNGKSIPVAIGAPNTPTPTGTFYIKRKVIDPVSPEFDYGKYAIEINNGYGIHGVSNELQSTIGTASSLGCIRVASEHEKLVFESIYFTNEIIIQK